LLDKEGGRLGKDDLYISYLPAAHIFEQLLITATQVQGVKCAFYGGDVLKLI